MDLLRWLNLILRHPEVLDQHQRPMATYQKKTKRTGASRTDAMRRMSVVRAHRRKLGRIAKASRRRNRAA